MFHPKDASRQGLARPFPPPASSTNPYFASWRRWNEQVVSNLSRRHLQGGGVAPLLDRDDRLPGHADLLGELRPRHLAVVDGGCMAK